VTESNEVSWVLIVAIVVPIVGVLLIVAAVVLLVPSIRVKVFPHRDRAKFKPTPKESIY